MTLSNPTEEARRLVDLATEAGLIARVIGGVAISIQLGDAMPNALVRSYNDIDLVIKSRDRAAVTDLMVRHGYLADTEFNRLHGNNRLIFVDTTHDRQVDIFVERFEMCHRIPLAERLEEHRWTVPLPELLLTKLQIIKLNAKDRDDLFALLLFRPTSEGEDDDRVDARIAEICARDWGLFHTVERNLEVLDREATGRLSAPHVALIRGRLAELRNIMTITPKTIGWKMRAKVGERVLWYEDPEEVTLIPADTVRASS